MFKSQGILSHVWLHPKNRATKAEIRIFDQMDIKQFPQELHNNFLPDGHL